MIAKSLTKDLQTVNFLLSVPDLRYKGRLRREVTARREANRDNLKIICFRESFSQTCPRSTILGILGAEVIARHNLGHLV